MIEETENPMTEHEEPARPVTIDAPAGRIEGTQAGTARRFLGIPYAEAPVGALRFAAPVPRPPFAETFVADRQGATPQRVPLFATTTIPEPSIPGDDTLTVNVFAPAADGPHPVLVWIHGGGYIAGSPASPWYDGSAFARDGVVTVTVGYRLGVDGFGVVDGAPDNRGLRDQIAALEWVRANISAFGGDPARVTIAGQSAGGGSVLALLASPSAAGLFRAAICVSGVDLSLDPGAARAATVSIAGVLGVEPTADGFGPRDDGSAMRAILSLREADPTGSPLLLGPAHGGEVLPRAVSEALASASLDVPLLMGSTADEFDGGATPENPERAGAAPAPRGQRVTDVLFRSACPRTAAARAREGAAGTWLYSFDWPSPVMGGATHCIDLPFLFDGLHAEGVVEALGEAPPQSLADAVHRDAVAFVHGEEPGWPRAVGAASDAVRVYDADGRAHVVAGAYDDVRAGEEPRAGS